jgi:hypothetical protein
MNNNFFLLLCFTLSMAPCYGMKRKPHYPLYVVPESLLSAEITKKQIVEESNEVMKKIEAGILRRREAEALLRRQKEEQKNTVEKPEQGTPKVSCQKSLLPELNATRLISKFTPELEALSFDEQIV